MECYRAFLFAGSAVYHKYFDGTPSLPSDYGMIGMLAVFFRYRKLFIDSGFSDALVQKEDKNRNGFINCFLFQYYNICTALYFIVYWCSLI